MALPATAKAFPQAIDPKDVRPFYLVVSQGAVNVKPARLLGEGVSVKEYSLALTPEAVAAGMQVLDDTEGRVTELLGNVVKFWPTVVEDMQDLPLFDGRGVTVGVQLTFTTTDDPSETLQRTALVRIANQ